MTRGHLVLEHAIDQISVGFSLFVAGPETRYTS